MSGGEEITITLTTLAGRTESISVSPGIPPSELGTFASAILGFGPDEPIELTRDGQTLTPGAPPLRNGDMVLVARRGQVRRAAAGPAPAPAAAPGGLDFSSLLAGAGASSASASSATTSASGGAAAVAAPTPPPSAEASVSGPAGSSGGGGAGAGGLSFNLPPPGAFAQSSAVEWAGMSLDDAVRSNSNPEHFATVLMSDRHPNLMKELNYHSPHLAKKMREAGDVKDAARVWREEMMKGSIQSAYASTMSKRKESEMQARLRANPHDEEANKYFGEKIQRENVDAQYRQMMEEYPESMGRVLMLYIDAEVNGKPIQAFVDSGAQSTIMSSKCAERCGLLHLLDSRFEGTAVGVGTGKILGRVHIAPLKVGGHFFPCTITVMDSEKGLGDKNMDFLFGLDMLKRHRCKIDLQRNCLVFTMGDGGDCMEAPFLHEKDLDENKGGTKGFDAEKSNAELEQRIQDSIKKQKEEEEEEKKKGSDKGDAKSGSGKPRDDEESGYDGGVESEVMDVDETEGDQDGTGKKAKKRPNGGS